MIQILIAMLMSLPDQHITATVAADNVNAAIAAETSILDAPLLLSVAYRESRFDATSVAGVHCGIMQTVSHGKTKAKIKADCLAQQDYAVGYSRGVDELNYWLGRSHGSLALALAHHRCGNKIRWSHPATATHKASKCDGVVYAGHVLRMASKLRAAYSPNS